MEKIQLYLLSNSLPVTSTLKYSLELKKNIVLSDCSKDLDSTLRSFSNRISNKPPYNSTHNVLFVDDIYFNNNKLTDFLKILPEKFSEVKTVIYTDYIDNDYVNNLISCKVRGLLYKEKIIDSSLLKDIFSKKIIRAIETVNAGYTCIDDIFLPSIIRPIWMKSSFDGLRISQTQDLTVLTCRERQILLKIAEGKKSSEIAKELFISSNTMDSHYANIKEKINIKSTNELAVFAAENKAMIKFLLESENN